MMKPKPKPKGAPKPKGGGNVTGMIEVLKRDSGNKY